MSAPGSANSATINHERPVHSIDEEPKTGSTKGRLISIILIVILVVIGIIFLAVAERNKNAYTTCLTKENPSCYQFTCPGGSTTQTCGVNAYRCSKSGYMNCSNDPYTDVAIANGEAHLCQPPPTSS